MTNRSGTTESLFFIVVIVLTVASLGDFGSLLSDTFTGSSPEKKKDFLLFIVRQ
jgi:hypothetical protein